MIAVIKSVLVKLSTSKIDCINYNINKNNSNCSSNRSYCDITITLISIISNSSNNFNHNSSITTITTILPKQEIICGLSLSRH